MPKIKEIKKFGSKIKEVKKETKVIDLEEEISQGDTENFAQFIRGRRFNTDPTLDQDEAPQQVTRLAPLSKEDEAEAHFRPNYVGGGNPYQDKSYSSQMERGNQTTSIRGETGSASSTLRQESSQQTVMAGMGAPAPQNDGRGAGRPEQGSDRQYAEAPKKEKRSAM